MRASRAPAATNESSLARVRAWWLRQQGLTPATAPKTIEECVRQTGWLQTSGSTAIYLTIRARMPGTTRDAIDRAAITHPDGSELFVGALVDLTIRGVVRRFPADGRLDSSKYMYELRHPDDRPDLDAEGDAAAVVAKAVEHFLQRHGPATMEELTWWGELTKGAARKALGALGAESLAVPGWAKEAWLLPGDMPAWRSFKGAGSDRVLLLPYRDPFVHRRRGPAVLARNAGLPVLDGELKRARIGDVNSIKHHTILSGSEVVGVWEYDSKTESVVTRLWNADAGLRRRVTGATAETASFISQQLGDAKLSAVDPPGQRARRLAFCRAK